MSAATIIVFLSDSLLLIFCRPACIKSAVQKKNNIQNQEQSPHEGDYEVSEKDLNGQQTDNQNNFHNGYFDASRKQGGKDNHQKHGI